MDLREAQRGLGVRVVRDLVRGLGGRIVATTGIDGHGSRIVVALPVEPQVVRQSET
jgi:K+-sensing histidine kinase KdpD